MLVSHERFEVPDLDILVRLTVNSLTSRSLPELIHLQREIFKQPGQRPPEFRLNFARMLCQLLNVVAGDIVGEDDAMFPLLPANKKKSAYK